MGSMCVTLDFLESESEASFYGFYGFQSLRQFDSNNRATEGYMGGDTV